MLCPEKELKFSRLFLASISRFREIRMIIIGALPFPLFDLLVSELNRQHPMYREMCLVNNSNRY